MRPPEDAGDAIIAMLKRTRCPFGEPRCAVEWHHATAAETVRALERARACEGALVERWGVK